VEVLDRVGLVVGAVHHQSFVFFALDSAGVANLTVDSTGGLLLQRIIIVTHSLSPAWPLIRLPSCAPHEVNIVSEE
jgi:hypothetical protein